MVDHRFGAGLASGNWGRRPRKRRLPITFRGFYYALAYDLVRRFRMNWFSLN